MACVSDIPATSARRLAVLMRSYFFICPCGLLILSCFLHPVVSISASGPVWVQTAAKEPDKLETFFNTYKSADSDAIGPEGTSLLS